MTTEQTDEVEQIIISVTDIIGVALQRNRLQVDIQKQTIAEMQKRIVELKELIKYQEAQEALHDGAFAAMREQRDAARLERDEIRAEMAPLALASEEWKQACIRAGVDHTTEHHDVVNCLDVTIRQKNLEIKGLREKLSESGHKKRLDEYRARTHEAENALSDLWIEHSRIYQAVKDCVSLSAQLDVFFMGGPLAGVRASLRAELLKLKESMDNISPQPEPDNAKDKEGS